MSARLLDPVSLPIQGQCLIEASAGTGKTFTLAALYLRLLLGLGKGQQQSPLGVQQILVVTFTEAATQELRDRIRSRIREARQAFQQGSSDDPILKQLLAESDDHQDKAKLLELAASEMDQASVFTIHGFCQRMLRQHAFESGAMFTQELTADAYPLVRQALLDFWRDYFYTVPDALAEQMLGCFKTPDDLLKEIQGYLGLSGLLYAPDYRASNLVELWHAEQTALDQFKAHWLTSVEEAIAVIQSSGVDKRSYKSNTLANWSTAVTEYALGNTQITPWNEIARFSSSMLTEKTKKGIAPEHPIFIEADKLIENRLPLKGVLISLAITGIKQRLDAEKSKQHLMTFDDLLTQLASALQKNGGERLAEAIRQQYPVAMIDEFQDTDPLQYAIFNQLYPDQETALLMIGDPKQSIYAFRGADIFTYMQARKKVSAHYTLATNWRSSTAMVNASNALFHARSAPFIYDEDIPFQAVNAAGKVDKTPYTINGNIQAPLQLWVVEEPLKKAAYIQYFAKATAVHVHQSLTSNSYQIGDRGLQPSDIAILVRDRNEAREIEAALRDKGISSVFLSNRDSVFKSIEAQELLYILQAIAEPTDERTMRSALATGIFHLTMHALDELCRDELAWEALVDEFYEYRTYWEKLGVLAMLHHLLAVRKLAGVMLAFQGGERRLTDLLHLGELLQKASQETEGLQGQIRWLSEQIAEPNQQSDEQQMRLESDRSRVTIITMHKSKGLEYEIVYLPFISCFKESKSLLYHDLQGATVLNVEPDDEIKSIIEKERLAEDLRLLYVAVTRAVHACYLGVADILYGTSKEGKTKHSALGYLLMEEGETLGTALERFAASSPNIVIQSPPAEEPDVDTLDMFTLPTDNELEQGHCRPFNGNIDRQWRVTSYSSLSRFHEKEPVVEVEQHLDLELFNEDKLDTDAITQAQAKTIFNFPRGAVAGTFLHTLFEKIDFQNISPEALDDLLETELEANGYTVEWQPVLSDFIQTALNKPLAPYPCRLNDISTLDRLVEMEFVLPFNRLQAYKLNQLLREYDPLAAKAGNLVFDEVEGMLKGYVDLTFRYQGQYFIADYKSNHLGDHPEAYNEFAMATAMIEHRYDFQYVLYTLALHRLLKVRKSDYDYETDIGGVFYLFLRGLNADSNSQAGIFYTKPRMELILALDALFEEGC
jgi:exodeoxyribonuclease V beta subunit